MTHDVKELVKGRKGWLGTSIIWGAILLCVASVTVTWIEVGKLRDGPGSWGTYAAPTVVGEWDGGSLVSTRIDDGNGLPMVDRVDGETMGGDYEVPLVFSRCGPDEPLLLRSRRTWEIEWTINDVLIDIERIEGEVIDLPTEATPGCFLFQARLHVSPRVISFARSRLGNPAITLTLVVESVSETSFSPAPVRTEQFVLDEGQPFTVIERSIAPQEER